MKGVKGVKGVKGAKGVRGLRRVKGIGLGAQRRSACTLMHSRDDKTSRDIQSHASSKPSRLGC